MPNGRLRGKNAVIPGGAEGVGGAASEIFAREGANVAIIDIPLRIRSEKVRVKSMIAD